MDRVSDNTTLFNHCKSYTCIPNRETVWTLWWNTVTQPTPFIPYRRGTQINYACLPLTQAYDSSTAFFLFLPLPHSTNTVSETFLVCCQEKDIAMATSHASCHWQAGVHALSHTLPLSLTRRASASRPKNVSCQIIIKHLVTMFTCWKHKQRKY